MQKSLFHWLRNLGPDLEQSDLRHQRSALPIQGGGVWLQIDLRRPKCGSYPSPLVQKETSDGWADKAEVQRCRFSQSQRAWELLPGEWQWYSFSWGKVETCSSAARGSTEILLQHNQISVASGCQTRWHLSRWHLNDEVSVLLSCITTVGCGCCITTLHSLCQTMGQLVLQEC